MTLKTTLIPLCVFLLSGCLGGKNAQQRAATLKRTFIPMAAHAQAVKPSPDFAPVKIRTFRVMPPFDGHDFLVRRAGGEFVTDYYNGWVASPGDLIRVQATRYLQDANVFTAVYDAGCGVRSPLGIEGIVEELYLDYSGETPAAVISLRLLVMDERSPELNVLFSTTAQGRMDLSTSDKKNPEDAFGRALTAALTQVTQALTQADLPKTPETLNKSHP